MIISIEIMKRINATVTSGKHMPISQLVKECGLDADLLGLVAGDLEQPLTSMNLFFRMIASYLAEMQKRVKMMGECYTAIQKLQIEHKIIEVTADDKEPAIVWTDQSEGA